jgi:glycine/D-amino acid oxidase-like deaminating enzyme
LTTLAIIGAGIAGRSLIYALAKEKKSYSKIVIFDSDTFARTCSHRSTAIVSLRGVSSGHSDLGDLIVNGLATFSSHVANDLPKGIFPITQYSGATEKLDQFKKRFSDGDVAQTVATYLLNKDIYFSNEPAFLVDPDLYLKWLLDESRNLPILLKDDFVLSCNSKDDGFTLRTQSGEDFEFDQVVFTGGAYNHFWGEQKVGRGIQGSYFEFNSIDLNQDSFSLTLDGDNIIYHSHSNKLLVGSTTFDFSHELASYKELSAIYKRLRDKISFPFPPIESGRIITGLREKASKRRPYLFQDGNKFWLGGLYKNGYSLSLHLAYELVKKL